MTPVEAVPLWLANGARQDDTLLKECGATLVPENDEDFLGCTQIEWRKGFDRLLLAVWPEGSPHPPKFVIEDDVGGTIYTLHEHRRTFDECLWSMTEGT